MPIYSVKAPNGKIYDVNAPENASQEDLFGFVQQQLDEEERRRDLRKYGPGYLETFGQSIARGAGQLGSTFTDIIPAAVGSAFGFEDYAKEQLAEAKKKEEEREAKYPTLFKSYKEIEGLGDFAKFATETVGEQVANIATSLIPGMGLGAAASRTAATGIAKNLAAQAAEKGLAGRAAEQFIKEGMEKASSTIAKSTLGGEAAGVYLGSYAQNAPEVFQNIYEETGQLAPGAAALFGSVSAALDSVLPAKLASQLPNPFKAAVVGKVLENSGMEKGLVRSLMIGVLKGAGTEGITEGAQEAISIAAERFVSENPNVFGSKEWDRIIESAIKGAVAGGAFGGVGGGAQGLRARAEKQRREAEEARARGEEERARKLDAEVAQTEAQLAEIEQTQPQMQLPGMELGPATELVPPTTAVEPKVKEPKVRQAEMFTEEGELTPQMEKLAAKDEKAVVQRQKELEAQFKKDQQELKARLEEIAPEGIDLVGLAQRPPPIEQTLQKVGEPLEKLQQRGMRKGELGLEAQREIGWNEEWNTLVPNIAELAQPEFRKALTSDVNIPVETRQGIIEAGKKAGIIPKTARYSYPDVTSTKVDDLRKISKDVFGVGASAKFLREPPGATVGEGGIAGLDFANPEHAPQLRAVLNRVAETTTVPDAATKIEGLLNKFLPEGAPSATRIDEQTGRAGVEVPVGRGAGAAPVSVEPSQPSGVDVAPSDVGQPVGGEVAQPRPLTPEERAAEAEFLGEEQVPIEERGAMLRRPERRQPTPEEARAIEKEATEIIESEAPVEPITNKTIRRLVNEFFGENYLDPNKKLYLPRYEGPAFDAEQRRLAEAGDINGLIRNLLDSNKDPSIKQVLRRIRSLNLKTKVVIGDPVGEFALPALREPFVESKYRPSVVAWAKKNFGNREYYGTPVWQNFVAWFGDSKIVNEQGEPLVMYHGTARGDVRAFKTKQANAIFVTPDPTFAESFGGDSQLYMDRHWDEFLTKEQQQQVYDDVRNQLIESENKKSKSLADEFIKDPQEKQGHLDRLAKETIYQYKKLTNAELDDLYPDLVRDTRRNYFPSGPNIMPLFVRAERVFDFEKGEHVSALYNAVEKFIQNPRYAESVGGQYLLSTDGLNELRKLKDYRGEGPGEFRQRIASGDWNVLENGVVQYLIRNVMRADGFYMFETRFGKSFDEVIGGKNLAVYNQNQVKSVTNRGRFSERPPILGLPKAGAYDPDTDTIYLDPELGMNAHTFIHEVIHAAVSNVLRNTNHPLTEEFEKFFVSIKDRMGGAYGGTDLQEFAAELISNPSFQALLKTIKTPKSESLFTNILRKIAEFFGITEKKFVKGMLETTAFKRGLEFIESALDLTGGMEAVPGERMFLGMGDFSPIGMVEKAMPAPVGRAVENVRNTLSNLGGGSLLEEALGALRLDNLRQIYKQLPSIDTLQDALEKRTGREEADIKRVNDKYMKFVGVQQKHPEQMRLMDDLSIRASQAEIDITKPFERRKVDPSKMSKTQQDVFNMAERKREQDHRRLREEFLRINPEVREVYESIRKDYDDAFKRYRKIIEDAAEGQPGLAAQLREEFETRHPLTGYVPFLRRGDYWLEFTSPETDAPVVMAFDSIRERDLFIEQNLKGIPNRKFQRFEDIQYNADNIPPTHFIAKVITGLRKKNASQEQINSVYQAYLAAFPAESMAKQFMKRRGIEGMDKDLVRGYGDLMVRWTRKLINSEYTPQIDRALIQIAQEATDQPPDVAAAAKSILRQKAFFHNPSYGKWVSRGTALSYYEFMAGNISSGIINLTSLPLMVFPMLAGKFNYISAGSAILSAMKESLPGNNWQNDPKYKKLYDTLMDHGQLEHTMAREVLEGRRQKTEDYSGVKAKITELVSLPFSVSEKWNRATTAIAAFNLAKDSGMSEEKAIRYALETTRTAHTSGMAATSARWLQTPFGRLFGTFKSIIWQQAYVIARAFYEAAKGADAKTRNAARHQLLAMYGMATVFVGVKGMPFYGAMSVLAEMLNTMFGDDDEPFIFDEFMRDLLPMFLYKGLANYFLNLEVANRAGLATDIIFRDDPYGIAKHGYVLSALQQAFGPLGSIGVNAERSVKLFKDGEYARSFEASLPSALRNILKSVRYMNEGATTLDGEPIMEDISAYNNLMQVIGFAPADLSNRYEMLQAAKTFEREILQRRQKALRMMDMAITAGDMDAFEEAVERIDKFNEANPDFAITANSIQRSQRARKAAEKDSIYGTRFNKNLLPRIRSEFFEDEE